MKKIILIIIVICSFQNSVIAQTDSLIISGEMGLRGKWQTGNFAQFVINPNGRIVIEKRKTRIEVRANYEFLKINQGSLINDFWSFGMYQYNSNKTIYPMGIAHYGFAQSYAIDQSLVSGIGAGININNKDKRNYFQANLFAGYMNLKYENFQAHKAPGTGTYIKIMFPIKKEFVYFILDLNGYISLNDIQFRGFNNRMIVNFQVLKNLGVNLSYRLIHNNNALIPINKTNGKLVFGLNYTFN